MTQTTQRNFRRLAVVTAVLVWALITVGGVVRVSGSGMGCADDWPLCEGRVVPVPELEAILEYLHRIIAALVTLSILLVVVNAWRHYRKEGWLVIPAVGALVLVIAEALLGAVVVWLELPPLPVAAHLAISLIIFALAIVVAVAARDPEALSEPRGSDSLSSLLWLTIPAMFLLMLSGALVTGSGAEAACPSFPLCNGYLVPPPGLTPQRIQMFHRLWMLILAVLAALVVVHANQGDRPREVRVWSWGLGGLFLAQVSVGIAQVLTGLPVALRSAHVAFAAGVWGALITLAMFAMLHRPVATAAAPETANA